MAHKCADQLRLARTPDPPATDRGYYAAVNWDVAWCAHTTDEAYAGSTMDEMRRLDAARQDLDQARRHRAKVLADLQKASAEAHTELRTSETSMEKWAAKAHVAPSALSLLATDREWKPRGSSVYEAIDGITGGRYRLAELRAEFDAAEAEVTKARGALRVADAAAVAAEIGPTSSRPYADTAMDVLLIDDVLVNRRPDRVILDVRLRNPGACSVNVTRAVLRILERRRFLTVFHPTADYDLLVEDDVNQVPVSHHIRPDEVDRFTLRVRLFSG